MNTKIIITILLVLFALDSFSQIKLNKNLKYAAGIQVIAGFADGTNQAFLFHNHGQFGSIKSNNVSWVNKWAKDENGNVMVGKERFFGSSTFLVFTTDFHHFTRFVENRSNESSMLVYAIGHGAKRKRLIDYVADFGILFLSRSLGFHAAYSVTFK